MTENEKLKKIRVFLLVCLSQSFTLFSISNIGMANMTLALANSVVKLCVAESIAFEASKPQPCSQSHLVLAAKMPTK